MVRLKQYWIDFKRYIINRPHSVVAEIGVHKGRLTYYLLDRLDIRTYYCVDPWDDEQIYTTFIHKNERFGDRIVEKKMTSVDAAKTISDRSIDVVFIDADHSYSHVKEDITAWLPKVKPGGLLSGHDYGIQRFDVTQAVEELLPGHTQDKTLWYYEFI